MSRNRLLKPLAALLALTLGTGAAFLTNAHAAVTPAPAPAAAQDSGVYYEIFVRAWYDTNGDGIGDLNGVTAKLDYLKSLGISGIWLMPINNSPSYHGYDITDYYGINPQYGTMADFQHLLDEAHKRGIAVTMDMVINHTAQEHPWFVAAQKVNDPHHDWYTWTTKRPNLDAMSAVDSKIWHPADDGWYIGVFGGHMPDLNYDNPAVRAEMIKMGQFWLSKGVDGFRLDAAKHIYVDFKSDEHSLKALEKNVAWWTEYRDALAKVNPKVSLVGEVSAESPKVLAPYLKPLGSIFDFPLAEQLIVSAKSENVGKLDALLKATYDAYKAAEDGPSCASCARGTRPSMDSAPFIDSTFLSNHDQERVMSRLGGNQQHMRMAAAMLLTLPGRPYLYYGEELGMEGKKPDPNLREPMRWQREPATSMDGRVPKAQDAQEGRESRWKPSSVNQGQRISVQAEQDDPSSLYNTYRTLIGWRAHNSALRDGKMELVATGNPCLLAFWRDDGKQRVLVVHNLSGKDAMWKPKGGLLPKEMVVLLSTQPQAYLESGRLKLPAYSTVVLH